MEKKRDSFVFYRSFYESISTLDDEAQLQLYRAIVNYSLNQEEPILTGVALGFWTLIRPNLEANNKRWENGSQPKQKQNRSKTEANNKQNRSKTEANKDKDKDKDEEKKSTHAQLFQSIQDSWNSIAEQKGISKVALITKPREDKLKTRLKEQNFLDVLEFIFSALLRLPSSHNYFGNNKSNWKISLDYLIDNGNNYIKVYEELS